MKLFGRGDRPAPKSAAQRRIERMSTHDLMAWLDVCVLGLGRLVDDARRDADGPALQELEDGATVVAAVAAELRQRGL